MPQERSRLAPSQGKAWEPLGGDCFKALGGGAAAKKGQEKEKAKMFTEKKASGKYDGEIKPIQGMALRSRLGRARRPTQRERKHQAVGSPTNASQPHEHPLLEGQPVCRLQDQVSQFRWSSRTSPPLEGGRTLRPQVHPPAPSLLQQPQRVWLGLGSQQLLCLTS